MMRLRLQIALALCLLASVAASRAQQPQRAALPNRAPLPQNAFYLLPLGSIQPAGWLRNQLQIQAAGLTGHLDEFWPDVSANSGWLGGSGEAWERGPYFLDGMLPAAYLLNDPVLKAKANKWVEWTITHQQPDGEIGPARNNDWWPRMVMLKVLTQYQEATGDPRVLPLMTRYFDYELRELPHRPLQDWGKYRWEENVLTVLWLYNRSGDPRLLRLAKLLRQEGFDWKTEFEHFPFTAKTTRATLGLDKADNTDRAMEAHGVNNAMALKASPLSFLVSGDRSDRAAVYQQIAELEKYHLLPNGVYSGDEHFAGDDPSQGVELCTVVESMFSWEQDIAVFGDARFADRLERITFNALPGTLSDDMWSHQYDQQPNQVSCTRADRQWSSNGPDSNLFGLEPHFGCCTANLHQGWPKFAESLWMATPGGGLAAIAYAPNRVTTQLLHGEQVSVDEDTEYPFRPAVRLTMHTTKPAVFPLLVRIPGWSAQAAISINGAPVKTPQTCIAHQPFDGRLNLDAQDADNDVCANSFATLARRWKEGDVVELRFPMQPRFTRWYHNSVAVERGPLLFSLKMEEHWEKLRDHAERSADWQLTPASAWNYALDIDPDNPAGSVKATESVVGDTPFSLAHPAVELSVHGQQISTWTMQANSAGPLPESPVATGAPIVELTLVPYAAAKLRITAFPLASPTASSPPRTDSR